MVTSRSTPEEIREQAIRTVAMLRKSGQLLGGPDEPRPYYVLDGRLYRVLADDGYSAFGDYHSYCHRMRHAGKKYPWL